MLQWTVGLTCDDIAYNEGELVRCWPREMMLGSVRAEDVLRLGV